VPSPTTAESIAHDYWEAFLRVSPVRATNAGDERYDDRLDDPTAGGRAERAAIASRALAALDLLDSPETRGTPPTGRDPDDVLTGDCLRFACEAELAQFESARWRLQSVDHMDHGPAIVLTMLAQTQPADTPERLDRWLARLAAAPAFIDGHIAVIEESRALRILPAAVVARRVLTQLDNMVEEPAAASALATAPRVAHDADRERIAAVVASEVQPALARLRAVVADLLPVARTEPGLGAVPGGEAMYASAILEWTTTAADPGGLHSFGLEDLARIDGERLAVARSAGHADANAYRRALESDPANIPTTVDELLGRLRDGIARAQAAAPAWFGRLPAAACGVEPLSDAVASTQIGYFIQASPDGRRPGIFYLNTGDLPTRLYSRNITTIFHETIPGHHLQLGIQSGLPGLSAFRRDGVGAGAFVEGWGLYAERLADEMGLFETQGERFGMLDAQAWRAIRLVVDTGIHAFGWSRERAIDAFIAATGFVRGDAEIEVDRYIAIPGQALSYRVGQREIERLRAGATARATASGATLDVRAFHDELLGRGALPLAVLAARIDAGGHDADAHAAAGSG